MVLLLVMNLIGLKNGTGSWVMIAGILILFAASAIQELGVDVFSPLDRNGLYHLISMAGVVLVFLGGAFQDVCMITYQPDIYSICTSNDRSGHKEPRMVKCVTILLVLALPHVRGEPSEPERAVADITGCWSRDTARLGSSPAAQSHMNGPITLMPDYGVNYVSPMAQYHLPRGWVCHCGVRQRGLHCRNAKMLMS
jgi:hypothetical protein